MNVDGLADYTKVFPLVLHDQICKQKKQTKSETSESSHCGNQVVFKKCASLSHPFFDHSINTQWVTRCAVVDIFDFDCLLISAGNMCNEVIQF